MCLKRFLKTKHKIIAKNYQKNRRFYSLFFEPSLYLGDCGFYFGRGFRFELVYLKLLRKRIKRVIRRAKVDSQFRYTWLNLRINFPISKKAKNARMGKGVGSFLR